MLVARHHKLFTSLVRLTAVATAMLMLTVLIVTRSEAAFSDTTDNTANSFTSGSVTITADDTGSALFTASTMTPGVPVVECIAVTYSGTLVPADIRLYGTSAGALAPYLDTTIEVGSGGGYGNCGAFTPSSTLYSGTLSAFSAANSNWATGLPTFTAAANPTSATLRFSVDVQDVPAAQGGAGSADFTFEAQD